MPAGSPAGPAGSSPATRTFSSCIGGNVRLLAQEKGASDIVEYSREKVFESRGVYPEQIVDYLALTGDSSDNVPGVPGVGDKTALKLLTSYKSIDGIFQSLDSITPESLRKKLAAGKESALLSRELVTLRRDVPGIPQPETLPPIALNVTAATPLLERQGMKTIVADLLKLSGKSTESARSAVARRRFAEAAVHAHGTRTDACPGHPEEHGSRNVRDSYHFVGAGGMGGPGKGRRRVCIRRRDGRQG